MGLAVQGRPREGAEGPGQGQTLTHPHVPAVPWLTPSWAKSSPTLRNLARPGLPEAPPSLVPAGPSCARDATPWRRGCGASASGLLGAEVGGRDPDGPLTGTWPLCGSLSDKANLKPQTCWGELTPRPAHHKRTYRQVTFYAKGPTSTPWPRDSHPTSTLSWSLPQTSLQPWGERH